MTGCSYAEADEVRRSMGSPDGQLQVRGWFLPLCRGQGYPLPTVERVREVLRAFASLPGSARRTQPGSPRPPTSRHG